MAGSMLFISVLCLHSPPTVSHELLDSEGEFVGLVVIKQRGVQVVQANLSLDAHVESLVTVEGFSATESGTCIIRHDNAEEVARRALARETRFKRLASCTRSTTVRKEQSSSCQMQPFLGATKNISSMFPIDVRVANGSSTVVTADCHDVQFARS